MLRVGLTARITADGLPNMSFTSRVVSVNPRMATKMLHSDRPNELYATKTREVLLEVSGMKDALVGLRVDVEFSTKASTSREVEAQRSP